MNNSLYISQLAGLRILVVGDVTLDEYLYGRATRLSREAPVPVLEIHQRDVILGGSANPSRNIVSLGSTVIQVGVVGDDLSGEQLRTALQDLGILSDGLVTVSGRITTTKTRVMASQSPRLPQQLVRLDSLDRRPIEPHDEDQIRAILVRAIPQVQAVLCSDYQLGLLTATIVDTIRSVCREHNVLMTVDTQGNSHYYWGVDVFRCNDVEASAALGLSLQSEDDFRAGLRELHSLLDARLVMVTRGPDGVSILGDTVPYTHLPSVNVSEVYDTTGAGDTFIAVTTLALAAGLEPLVAARLANMASALVVRKFGNATVRPEELAQAMDK